MESAIGIMEGAFFVSKGEIIDWINKLLKVKKIVFFILFYCIYEL